ncbi:MAG: hypothetical protein KC518_00705 [Candidatus Cloacimonetes bacterium]|nr:hypothetical protein [Candidatus Cloacimonadota bacterium]
MSVRGNSPTARVLHALERVDGGAHSDKLILGELTRQSGWNRAERGSFVSRFRGVLELRRDLDRRLGPHLRRPPRSTLLQALRLGLHDLDAGVPPWRVLAPLLAELESVSAPERGLVNGVLRGMLRSGETPRAESAKAMGRLPAWLTPALASEGGPEPELLEQRAAALLAQPDLWLRVRREMIEPDTAMARLEEAGLEPRRDPWGGDFITLGRLPEDGLAGLEGLNQGWLVVQDASTLGAVELLDARPGMRVLDACAAPGNKSLALLDRWPGIELTANEVDEGRARSMARRLGKRIRVQQIDLREIPALPAWPRILLDLPCSGSGSVARRPEILLRDSSPLESGLAVLQEELLEAASRLLEPDGVLVYSTCSLLDEENGQRIRNFLARHPEFRVDGARVPDEVRDTDGAWAWLPWRQSGAGGAWAIALRKT